jgi:hypothetical protein
VLQHHSFQSSMRHPYQCIHFCNSQAAENSKGILVAAAGPSLFVFNLLNGSILYQWSTGDAKLLESDKLENTQKPLESIQELPSHNCSTNRDQHVGNQKIKQINITKITSSLDGQHIVISTDLDKCIRVFQALSRNEFCLLSERLASRTEILVIVVLTNIGMYRKDPVK